MISAKTIIRHAVLTTSLVLTSLWVNAKSPCDDYSEDRRPLFGDLHVHTSYSFDSYISSQRNDPWVAYQFGKGEAITLPDADGRQEVTAQLRRPLDFMAVTDHAEFLGPINICTQDAGKLGYWFPACIATRSSNFILQLLAADYWVSLGVAGTSNEKERSFACTLSDCDEAAKSAWQDIQQATADHYEECRFTTFVGYEYTDAPDFKNLHRNVIFRNDKVTDLPISAYDTGSYNFPKLWTLLREQCLEGKPDCDVMSIPHNPNLSGGLMFPDPKTPQEAADRLLFEPVIELVQHKGASECRFDRLAGRGIATEDEACDFEQIKNDSLAMLGSVAGEVRTLDAAPVEIESFGRRNMIRNVLKDGTLLEQKSGLNPFKMGFIGSTDTHSAMPGAAEENNYPGHLGRRDAGYRNIQDHFFSNAGGLAVVWAKENTRDAVFDAIRRKETYATSGTRPTLRFFGGSSLNAALCDDPDMIQKAYDNATPMGGDLTVTANETPHFLVAASKDPGTPNFPGNDLQRAQIIKGWTDDSGKTHERIYNVAGSDTGASVNPESCKPEGTGYATLCAVWKDPDFDPAHNAFYYVRVLETPSCRWSTLQCKAAGVDPFSEDCAAQATVATQAALDDGAWGDDVYGKCCLNPEEEPFYSPVIQERAWSSPIWYSASHKKP
ncbi:hypothetical protein FHR99_000278 [Litorivivens lipolytica]|uniref:DUF3604 domain-containing protein n=1 Tax=Litorivivens lipolytica TaxID=1524264 RepID=A0A7W4W252_9GAMM|nr:DUF3604 domain-containing protein [Litorivivens lipolytica]MBB3046042.1 hypothetical protein [Litorivivens lipolytica]